MSPKPNPGSDEAVALGCKCPRMDNCYGRGYRTFEHGKVAYVIVGNCEMHWIDIEGEEEDLEDYP